MSSLIVLAMGYDECSIEKLLAASDPYAARLKIVAFAADDDDNRRSYEQYIFPLYGDRVTLYEGDIATNLLAYVQMRPRRDFIFTVISSDRDTPLAALATALSTNVYDMQILIGYDADAIERVLRTTSPQQQLLVLDAEERSGAADRERLLARHGERVALQFGEIANLLFTHLCARPHRRFVVHLAKELDGRPLRFATMSTS
jgi:hypothetical protein